MTATAIVTGAAGGIGRAVVDRLRETHHVIATDLSSTVEEMASARVQPVVADLAAEDGRAAVLGAARSADGPLQAIVNAVGITRDNLIQKMDEDDMRAVVRVNAIAPIALTLTAAEQMGEHASIVQISSRSHLGNIGQVNYAASKGALVGATRALARQLAPNIRVNAIAPGLIRTPMTEAMPPEVLEKLVARVLRGRIGEPEDVAAAVAHLVSTDADYVTGQTVYVCGGRSM